MRESLRLNDLSDRELIAVIDDQSGGDGWTGREALLATLRLDHPRPNQCLGARLGYLRRCGVVERDTSKEGKRNPRWRLTPIGEVVRRGRLRAADEQMLAQLGSGSMLELTRWITMRMRAEVGPTPILMRRQWSHGLHGGTG